MTDPRWIFFKSLGNADWKFKTVVPRLFWNLQSIEKQFSPAQVMKAKAVSVLSKSFL